MKKFLARLPLLIIGIPLTYWLIAMAGNMPRMIFFAVIAVLGQFELCRMLDKDARKPYFEWVIGLAMMAFTYWGGERALFGGFAVAVVATMLKTVFRGLKGDGIKQFCHIIFSLYYLPFNLSCYYLLTISRNYTGKDLFFIVASIWALDIGAYLFGMTLRGPKMSPKISPNKTISGAVGGFLCSVGFMHCAAHYGWVNYPVAQTIYAAIMIGIVGQVADLFESVIKRESDTKDSSAILGAHGGVLDRIDSILFLGPLCYFIFTL